MWKKVGRHDHRHHASDAIAPTSDAHPRRATTIVAPRTGEPVSPANPHQRGGTVVPLHESDDRGDLELLRGG
jgi:hypothetical protein